MDVFDDVSWTKRFQLALTRCTAAHIARRDGARFAQEDGTAGECCFVLRVADLESRYYSESRWQCTLLRGSR